MAKVLAAQKLLGDWVAALPATPCSKMERTEICLESHEALAAADQRNAAKFRDVIELMRAECEPALAR